MCSFGMGVLFLVVAMRVEDFINSPLETGPTLCTINHKNDILYEQTLPKQHTAEKYDLIYNGTYINLQNIYLICKTCNNYCYCYFSSTYS